MLYHYTPGEDPTKDEAKVATPPPQGSALSTQQNATKSNISEHHPVPEDSMKSDVISECDEIEYDSDFDGSCAEHSHGKW